MMSPLVRIDRHATEELQAATTWYEAQRPGLGQDLIDSIDTVIQRIREQPDLGGPVPGVAPESRLLARPHAA